MKDLVAEARAVLREKFLTADVGITGANLLIAETGSSVIVTNEGNGRLTTTCPRVHVALVGIEQVLPRFRAGDYPGGVSAGVEGAIAATKGEYKGSGKTQGESRRDRDGGRMPSPLVLLLVFLFFFVVLPALRGGRRGRYWYIGGGGFGGGGFGGGLGGFGGGGGGGGFSGGGGSFGGGGASGDW